MIKRLLNIQSVFKCKFQKRKMENSFLSQTASLTRSQGTVQLAMENSQCLTQKTELTEKTIH